MQFTETLEYSVDTRYQVHLDSQQVFPDDPGNGTPAIVTGPGGATATLWCAADTAELIAPDNSVHDIPAGALHWLQTEATDRANDFILAASMLMQPVAERDRETVSRLVQFWTAFESLDDLLNAQGGYRPSLDMREVVMAVIADTYDLEQANRGDPRRAHRYGGESEPSTDPS